MAKKLEMVYDIQIAPLMQKIAKICKDNSIPMVALFQYSEKNLVASVVSPDGFNNIIIDDDGLFRYQAVNFISDIVRSVQKTRD